MLDIKWIRNNPQDFDRGLIRRGHEPAAQVILELDQQWRDVQTEVQKLQSKRNSLSASIGQIKQQGGDASAVMQEVSTIKDKMTGLARESDELHSKLNDKLLALPNMPADDVPEGLDESANVLMRKHLEPSALAFEAKQHFELGEDMGGMDFETAAKLSGSRFTLLRGQLARLHRALAQFMIDVHTEEHGYQEITPPLLVKSDALVGTGQLPKFAEDQFRVDNDFWLIPTAEVPLTNLVAQDILEAGDFPLRVVAHTPCFRSEAGSAGRDTRGMLRQHQFEKVELVSIVHPDASDDEHERMTACAEEILKRLKLPYRVMALSCGDMGFSAKRTYDLEVWLPGQKAYREISSCSNCGDFQARRMKARFRPQDSKGTEFVHTLNGSGVAVGRALIAVMENYQDERGSIHVPHALKPYMGGIQTIG